MSRNYVLCIDQSGSMDTPLKPGLTRWKAVQESTEAISRKCAELDSDGIDVYTFNSKFQLFANSTPEKIHEIFAKTSPCGGTDFVPVLTDALEKHFKGGKPSTIIVITDGEPSDPSSKKTLAKLLIDSANKLEADSELAIQFIQIGSDPYAAKFLKALDDDLQKAGAKYDIVDAKTFEDLESTSITDVLMAAVND